MDRIIGIDYGSARVGVAVSDPLRIFASPMETVPSAKIIDYLKNYAARENLVRFVVGYPYNLDGRPSAAAADVDVFLKVKGIVVADVVTGHKCAGVAGNQARNAVCGHPIIPGVAHHHPKVLSSGVQGAQ